MKSLSLLFFAFLALSLNGQITQSIVFPSTGSAANNSIPAQSGNCRIEGLLQNWSASITQGQINGTQDCGLILSFISGNRFGAYWSQGNSGTGPCVGSPAILSLDSLPSKNFYFRFQKTVAGSGSFPALTSLVEFWDANGVYQTPTLCTYTSVSGSYSNGDSIGATDQLTIAFYRTYTTLVPQGSQMPVTEPLSSSGLLHQWKFDNSLADSSGNGYTATLTSTPCVANACYTSTGTVQNLVVSSPRTNDAPSWTNWIAMKAGVSNTLDGTQSFSQAASSSATTYNWAQNTSSTGCTGGGTAAPSSASAGQPTVTPPSFGPYCYDLQVTDANGNMATATLTAGAVGQDANGVVTSNSSDGTKMVGPMIAYGKNPWGWEDQRQFSMIALAQTYQTSVGYNPPPFVVKGAGTISYNYAGNLNATTLNGGITATATSIVVNSAASLDLTTLPGTPTDVIIGNGVPCPSDASIQCPELVRIASVSGNTLTVAYDGRGVARGAFSYANTILQLGAQVWPSGTPIGDQMTTGTSTLFATDSQRAVCPAGVPGPPGIVGYATGTLTMTAGSAVVTGSGTSWTVGNGVVAGNMIRIAATHASGTPFIFWAVINSVDSPTQLTLSRNAPTGTDGSTAFNYKTTTALYYSPSTKIPGSSPTAYTNIARNLEVCESETRLSSSQYYEAGAIQALGPQTSLQYSYKLLIGVTSFTFQNNYYGSGLAARNFWLRSGYLPAKTLADNIDENWVIDPEVVAGYGWFFGIRAAGGFIGAMADKVTNSGTSLVFEDLRQFGVNSGAFAALGNCAGADTRDTGSSESFVSLLALFDTAQQATWNGYLYTNSGTSWYDWDQACKSTFSTNSWANAGYFNNTFSRVTLTQGSKSVVANTGTFPSNVNSQGGCTGADTGTATATAGSSVFARLSGTWSVGDYEIAITGTRLGSPFTLYSTFRIDSAGQITTTGTWPSDATSGTVDWTTFNSPSGALTQYSVTAFAVDGTDMAGLQETLICTYVDPTHATLNRNWPINDGNNALRHINTGVGASGQQPFMLGGAKSLALQWASLNSNSTIASSYNALLGQATGWMYSTGFDPYSLGPFGARVFQNDEPLIVPSGSYLGSFRQSVGQAGVNVDALVATRELTAESSTSLRAYVASQNCSPASIAWADQQYGALWGANGYNVGVVYSDANTAGNNIGRSNLTDGYLGQFKWPGFFFGMGFGHQYPAVRASCVVGGVSGSKISGVRIGGPVRQ